MNRTMGYTTAEYEAISEEKGLEPHCPYADDYECLRYLECMIKNGSRENNDHARRSIEYKLKQINEKLLYLPLPFSEIDEDAHFLYDLPKAASLIVDYYLCPETNGIYASSMKYKYHQELIDFNASLARYPYEATKQHYSECDMYQMRVQSELKQTTDITNGNKNSVVDQPSSTNDNENKDINQDILLNCWTVQNGDVLKISAVQNSKRLGEVSFGLSAGAMSKQRSLIQLLIEEREVTVHQIFDCCYAEDKKQLKNNPQDAQKLLGRVRSLISDIRKKFDNAGINKEILTPLGLNIDVKSTVVLNVAAINNLDDKHEKNEDIPSYMPPDELSASDNYDD